MKSPFLIVLFQFGLFYEPRSHVAEIRPIPKLNGNP